MNSVHMLVSDIKNIKFNKIIMTFWVDQVQQKDLKVANEETLQSSLIIKVAILGMQIIQKMSVLSGL